jgi:hypothetical protein
MLHLLNSGNNQLIPSTACIMVELYKVGQDEYYVEVTNILDPIYHQFCQKKFISFTDFLSQQHRRGTNSASFTRMQSNVHVHQFCKDLSASDFLKRERVRTGN